MFPEFIRVRGFVIDVTELENVVVRSSAPPMPAASLPIVVLDVAFPVAVHSAHAALEPPTTSARLSIAARSTRTRRLTAPPASR
jgi:hypothetical protein